MTLIAGEEMTCGGTRGNSALGKQSDEYTKHLKNTLINRDSGNYRNNEIDQGAPELQISLLQH